MHKKITLHDVRFNWLQVLEPSAYTKGDALRYRAEVLIDPSTPAFKVASEAVESAAKEKWGERADGMRKVATSNGKCALKEGNHMPVNKKTFELDDYYKDMYVLSTSRVLDRDGELRVFSHSESKSGLVEVDANTTFTTDLVRPTSGSYGDVMVSLWGWEYNGAPQINCTLEAVAFKRQGDPLRAGHAATTDELESAFGAPVVGAASDVFAD